MSYQLLIFILHTFIFAYPLIMCIVWMVGGLIFWYHKELKWPYEIRDVTEWPPITILVPCYNEAKTIENTCKRLRYLNYPDYRVILIDDGSTDETAKKIESYVQNIPYYFLVRLNKNQGKATATNLAIRAAVTTSVVIVIDADTYLEKNALKFLVVPFVKNPRIGAVTGNPIPKNRFTFWAKFQAVEFSSIIGLIKRSQRIWGRILTVSGCITAYNREVLIEVGGFSPLTATEDIDITWKIQKACYEVWFVPQAVGYIQVPSKLKELWKQRCRWALGGWHLLRSHKNVFAKWKWKRLWIVYLEFFLGTLWAFAFVIGSILWLIGSMLGFLIIPAWHGAILSVLCICQMIVALRINNVYDKELWKCIFWMPWYPLLFYCLMALAVVRTMPKGVFSRVDMNTGKWQSPVREKDEG
ncbi:MAG: poly-beta,6-N-acetyl-D-glucosamine synthase [Clostridia bacterium]|nr:poly-beta,6-N-acetyl-D-glucosamine synthase [Clostridia bacterium]